jgi:hypothetical protein
MWQGVFDRGLSALAICQGASIAIQAIIRATERLNSWSLQIGMNDGIRA